MDSRHVLRAAGAAAMSAAWWHGHRWRRLQREMPGEVSSYDCVSKFATDMLCVYMGGSCSRASLQAAPVLGAMSRFGDVIASEYNLNLYTDEREYAALRSEMLVRLSSGRYRRVLVVGFGIGAGDVLRLVLELRKRGMDTSSILIDPLLSGRGLKTLDRTVVRLARHARPGPISNALAQPLIKQLITGRHPVRWEEGQELEVLENLAVMRSTKLSAFIRFGEKALKVQPFGAECFVDQQVTILWSEDAPTLYVQGAKKDAEEMFLLADLREVVIRRGRHGDFIAQPSVWKEALSGEVQRLLA